MCIKNLQSSQNLNHITLFQNLNYIIWFQNLNNIIWFCHFPAHLHLSRAHKHAPTHSSDKHAYSVSLHFKVRHPRWHNWTHTLQASTTRWAFWTPDRTAELSSIRLYVHFGDGFHTRQGGPLAVSYWSVQSSFLSVKLCMYVYEYACIFLFYWSVQTSFLSVKLCMCAHEYARMSMYVFSLAASVMRIFFSLSLKCEYGYVRMCWLLHV